MGPFLLAGALLLAPTAPAGRSDGEGVVYVIMASHWDAPWSMNANDIAALRSLSQRHPRMRWTHLYNPAAYTQSTPLLAEIEAYLLEARDLHGAEIGVHTHMYRSLVEAAGVAYHVAPDVWSASPPACGSDASGYTVPTTTYPEQDIRAILSFAIETFESRNLGRPRTFCAGFWVASPLLQRIIADLGFTTSAAALPCTVCPPCWYQLSGWPAGSISRLTTPYLVSTTTALPGGPWPYVWTSDGPLIELPQTCKIDWMTTYSEMTETFLAHRGAAEAGRTTAVCLVIHEVNAAEYFTSFDDTLTFIDFYVDLPGGAAVVYAAAAEARQAFVQMFALDGDADKDGDVDLIDFAHLVPCASGPGFQVGGNCADFDLDGDGDVDLADFARFQLAFTGSPP